MDPTERLANDLQTLKGRVDDLSLRAAIAEEREKRINDKIDGLVSVINNWGRRLGWVITAVFGVMLVAFGRWLISGQLAGF